jgi:hypothetical protein
VHADLTNESEVYARVSLRQLQCCSPSTRRARQWGRRSLTLFTATL